MDATAGAVSGGDTMTENKLYCDICQKQIYRHRMWYKLRRRMFEYDIFGEKRQLDICEDCYCLIVEMARSKEDKV